MIESRFGLNAELEFFPHTNSHEIENKFIYLYSWLIEQLIKNWYNIKRVTPLFQMYIVCIAFKQFLKKD